MAILGFEFEEIERIVALLETSGLEEIFWEEGERSIKVSAAPITSPLPALLMQSAGMQETRTKARLAPHPPQKAIEAIKTPQVAESGVALVSPMVGVFYRSGKPGDPPLVEIGQTVAKGQIVGILEAMKIFSEVEAEHGGIVLSCPAKDGQLVQAGTPLIILKR